MERIYHHFLLSGDDMKSDIDDLLHDTFRNMIEETGGNDGPNEEAKNNLQID